MGCSPSPWPPVRPPAGRGAGLPGWCCCDPTSPAEPQAGVGLVRPTYLPRLLMRELARILQELYRLAGGIFSICSGYREPRTVIFEAALSISRKSSGVSSTATDPIFSSRRANFVVPGIGTIHGF